VDGQAQPVRAGDSFFIPAADNRITLKGEMTVAVTGV
jgi:mannose-6-phosphate isomerase class I